MSYTLEQLKRRVATTWPPIKQKDLAEKLGLSVSHVSSVLNGKKKYSVDTVDRFHAAIDELEKERAK